MKMRSIVQNCRSQLGLTLGKLSHRLSEREQNEAEFKAIYTERASEVFALAEEEAARLHRDCIDTELILLGLVRFGRGIAVNALRRMGVDLEQLRLALEEQLARGVQTKVHQPLQLTPSVKKVLVRAQAEARALLHTYVGTEHILLGLLSDDGGGAARVLQGFGVSASEARRQILKELDPNEN
jgi:ATP-dependent Clp protease ATP-binding subunit ClpC